MEEPARRLNVVHQSLVKPVLVMGVERPLAIANWTVAAALILGVGNRYAALLGVLLITLGHWGLVELAKLDPQFCRVYIRHWRYSQDYYPARAGLASEEDTSGPWVVANWIAIPTMVSLAILALGCSVLIALTIGAAAGGLGHYLLMQGRGTKPTVPMARETRG